mgnify:CR=1 FL=1
MKRLTAVFVAALVLVAAGGVATPVAAGAGAAQDATEGSFPLTETDATGTEVTVDGEPERIVTLAPSAAQTLWELNASGKVVGVSDNADYLDGFAEKEVVSEGLSYDTETIVGLEPDLVLAPDAVADDVVTSLRDSGLTVYNFGPTANFSELYEKTRLTGQLAGECAAADATVADMRERVTTIEDAVADEERPGAFYSFFGFTAGANTFIDSIMTTAGTENVADTEMGIDGFPTEAVSSEVIANNTAAIEWLVLNSNPASHPTGEVYNQTTALQQNQTVVVNEDYLNQPAPRTVLAVENITRAIHPDAYEAAQASLAADAATATDASATDTDATTAADETDSSMGGTDSPMDETDSSMDGTATEAMEPATDATDAAAEATSGSGPGFTATAGVLALLAACLALLGANRALGLGL